MTHDSRVWRRCGYALLARVGVRPKGTVAHAALDAMITRLELEAAGHGLVVLDAGCGTKSPLRPFRPRLGHLLGVDLHRPAILPAYVDAFAVVDLCGPGDGLSSDTFDLVLSNFTIEHFTRPDAAFRTFRRCLRPGGLLVVTTVNRRHPFVAAYLGLPSRMRDRLQPLVKAGDGDVHPVVGACNDPASLRRALRDAGLELERMDMVSNLAHAWAGRPLPFAIGVVGDLLCHSMPARRSTMVVVARRPGGQSG